MDTFENVKKITYFVQFLEIFFNILDIFLKFLIVFDFFESF